MRPLLRRMFIVLLVICLTGCSLFTNTDKIQDKADLAFEQKEFDQFNKLYNELKEANPEKAEEYLIRTKEHQLFTNEPELDENIDIVKEIGKKVPDLTNFTNQIIYEHTVSVSIADINKILHKVQTDGTFITIMLMDTLDKVLEAEEALNSSLTDINRNLITLEDVTAPDDYKDNHDMFLASLKEYSEKLENQYMFFHVKGPNLVSSNTLLREGNIFSTISINDLEEEFKQYQSELDIATNNLGQRIRTISEEIDISPIYNVPNL